MSQADDFVGRRWAVDRIIHSVSTPDGSILITGQPGAGKSRLARRVLDEVAAAEPTRGLVTVWHECHANDDNTLVPWRLVTQLIKALSAVSPDYLAALSRQTGEPMTVVSHVTIENAYGSAVSGVSIDSLSLAGESARSALVRYVHGPLEEVSEPPGLMVLIDGLDEANSPGLASEFVDLVVHAIDGFRQSRLDVRFVLTCRTGEHTVLEGVAGQTLDLDRDEPNPGEDMHAYCRARLAATVDGADGLAWMLTGKASGNYLYSRCAISLLNEPGATLQASNLPAGLDRLYEAFIERRVAHDLRGRRWREVVRPVLAVISVAREPGISSADIADTLALPRSAVGDVIVDLREFLRLDEPTGCWRIFHESFRSFLHGWAPLKISAEESHAGLGRRFLEDPQRAPRYLRPNFAYHLNRAGLHTSLCDYLLHAEGVLDVLRVLPASQSQSVWQSACNSVLELEDHRRMAGLLARRLHPSAEPATGRSSDAHLWESIPTDAFGDLGKYDHDVVRNLALACLDALRPQTRHRAVERLSYMISQCRYSVRPSMQYDVAGLLADLYTDAALHELAQQLADKILDYVGLATIQRFLIDRGAVALAVTDALDTDSQRYRFRLMKYAITMSERRRRDGDAVTASHLAYAALKRHSGSRRTAFEDVAIAAALPWIPRCDAGDLPGILRRAAGTSLYRAEVLSTVGRPEVAGDAPQREAAIAEIESYLRDAEDEPTALWRDLYRAIAWRRHGHAERAHRLVTSVADRLPALGAEPDGRFVTPAHRDVVHGICLQGLVLECSLELSTLGDFERSRRLAASLLEFAAEDGVTAFLHLLHQMHSRGVAESEIASSTEQLFTLLDRHLPRSAADLAGFQAAKGISALIAPRLALQGIAGERLRSLCAASERAVEPGDVRADRAAAVLAAALAHAFDCSGNSGARDRCLSAGDAEAARQLTAGGGGLDPTLLRYLALSSGRAPVTARLRNRERSDLKDLRDYLADRDDHAGVARLNVLLGEDSQTLSTACLELRGMERPVKAPAAVEKCRALANVRMNRLILLAYVRDMTTGSNEAIDSEIGHEIELVSATLPALEFDLQEDDDQSVWSRRGAAAAEYEFALVLARCGRVEEAIRWHAQATADYDLSVENLRTMNLLPGAGDPYYEDRSQNSHFDEFQANVALNILGADRQLAVALAAAGEIGPARDIALAIVSDRNGLLGYVYGYDAADLDTRIQIALRIAAECGATDILNLLLEQVRDRAQVGAWVADRIGNEPRCLHPAVGLASLTRLAAATMGDRASMMRALASLIVADPATAAQIDCSGCLEIVEGGKGKG